MKLLVGLGNPGSRYANTRHNIGFMVLDKIAAEAGITISKKQNQSHLGQGIWLGQKVLLAKPQTYMNNSGEAVLELINYYQDGLTDLIVIHDDLDLDFGRIRFKQGGGTGGHNGLKSITRLLNSSDYDRLKVGIGRNPDFMKVESYVLSEFSTEEKKLLPVILTWAVQGIDTWVQKGITEAMNGYNAAVDLQELHQNEKEKQ